MSKLAEQLSEELENELKSFLNLSWVEQLEKAEQFFLISENTGSIEKSRRISLMFRELIASYKEMLENANEEYKEFSEFVSSSDFKVYLKYQFQDLIYRLPYYFLFTHLICDETYSQLDNETKRELREICGLKNPKARRDTFTNFFSFLIREKIKQGGSEGFWNPINRLYFLSYYNRFQIVIKNARKDLEKLVKKGLRESTARREILEKYGIPEAYSDQTFSSVKSMQPKELAMDWALVLVGYKGSADTIRTKVLPIANKESKKYNPSHKLVSVYKLNLNLAIASTTLTAKSKLALRYPDFRINEHTMLYYI